eukprot:TRINITY_DN4781_c0_g1_i1.p7 TRINITY_DN4781_c0_g1~~TRINITY_DN4781_c0_g1_i1.p7  ORF type:complete len:62 (+),score=32.36 TRINITY_DN4781_c0_g1_i1:316-501(+)
MLDNFRGSVGAATEIGDFDALFLLQWHKGTKKDAATQEEEEKRKSNRLRGRSSETAKAHRG